MSLIGGNPTTGDDNLIIFGQEEETVNLLAGNDIADVTGSNKTVTGDEGNDLIDGSAGTDNILRGGFDNDTIFGGSGGNINGNTGRDVIFGGSGNTILGGEGRDIFYIAQAEIPATPNTISDFSSNLDQLRISLLPDLTAFNQLVLTEADGNTTISFNGEDIAIIEGVAASALTADNVIVIVDEEPVFDPLPNSAPVIETQAFAYDSLGTVAATDADEDELTYAITDGNDEGFFAIDPITGALSLTDAAPENAVAASLTIEVSDGIADPVTGTVDITAPTPYDLDIDDNNSAGAFTDGILAIRYLFRQDIGGLRDIDLTGAIGENAQRTELADINDWLGNLINPDNTPSDEIGALLDIDNNDSSGAFTDGILAIRYMFRQDIGGLREIDLTGAIGEDAQRTDLTAINTWIADLIPEA
jgi:hypothetical protein